MKYFFALNRHLTARIITSPVSQTNVTGHGGVGTNAYFRAVQARYKQALRRM